MPILLNWKAAILAGLIAGVVFLTIEMILVGTVGGDSLWAPPRMIAAIAMGPDVLPPPATFDAGIVMVALIVHFALAVIYAFILGWIISRWQLGLAAAILGGVVFSLIIYVVNFYGFTALFPWFAMARNWISILAHVMFGLVLGAVYQAMTKSAVRAGPRSVAG